MNKYQEAYERIECVEIYEYAGARFPVFEMKTDYKSDLDVLKELVDRATPKKVIFTNVDITTHADEFRIIKRWKNCPICQSKAIGNYCQNCGQFLDWSEEQ